MRRTKQDQGGQQDLLRSRLDKVVDLAHPLAKLARSIDWLFLERLKAVYTDRSGRPPLPTRLVAWACQAPQARQPSAEDVAPYLGRMSRDTGLKIGGTLT
jgi:hypothetical protein